LAAVVLGVSTSFLGGGAAKAANPAPCSFGPSPSGTRLCNSNLWDSVPTSDKQIQILASYEVDYYQVIVTLDSFATGPTAWSIEETTTIDLLLTQLIHFQPSIFHG
jgi:hypothetical protein